MNIEKLYNDVRHCLDEQELFSEIEFSGEDSLPINARIKALFNGSFNSLQQILPIRLLVSYPMPITSLEADYQKGTGTIALPSDFLRISTFKMKGWKKAVHTMINDYDPAYKLQLNGATRGGIVNPVIARIDEGTTLQYFSLPKGLTTHEIEIATYIKSSFDIATSEIKDEAYPLLIWWLAKEVAVSFQRDTQLLDNQIKNLLSTYGN